MTQSRLTISQIVISPVPQVLTGSKGPVSIGVVLNNGCVYWGDYIQIDDSFEHIVGIEELATIERLTDLSASKLHNQHLSEVSTLWECIRPVFPPPGRVPFADGVSAAIQQALLAAVADFQDRSAVGVLADEFGLPPLERGEAEASLCPLFLEISDFAATAVNIDRMLAMRPAGVGYRITSGRVDEALGENAEFLQRFVRELGQRAAQNVGNSVYQPSIYLGLNGALGRLTDDPVRHIGKILGNCVGLQVAAGPRRLILEDPILLDDSTAQPANLHRLKDFMRRTPTSHDRVEPTILTVRDSQLDAEDITLYSNIQAVHAMSHNFIGEGGIDYLMARMTSLYHAQLGSYLIIRGRLTPRWIETSIDLALSVRAKGIVFSFDEGDESSYWHASRYLAETISKLNLQKLNR